MLHYKNREDTMDRDRILLPVVGQDNAARMQVARSAHPRTGPLVDSYGRRIRNLRISVTDRCNFRCVYCMPAEGLTWLPRGDILSYEEIERLVRVMLRMGVEEVRLTGGEPLVRKDLPALIRRLAPLEGLKSLSLTTNGYLLKEQARGLAEAGLRRVNVSLDSLDHEKFYTLTRRDSLPKVLEGLAEIEQYPSVSPIKINAVGIRGFSEPEVLSFARLARRTPYEVRWIEYMPLDADQTWTKEDVLTGAEIKSIIEQEFALTPVAGLDPSSTSRVYRFADGAPGTVGFINPVSEPFCAQCDRIRLTAEGAFRTCLFSTEETDLRAPLRAGASDDELEQLVRAATWQKELKHYIGDTRFRRANKSMSMIGG
jgi:cyclic pyranopterin phosphate synthase